MATHDPVLSPELVVTRHELSVKGEQVWLEFGWTLPEWETFRDYSIFTIQWRAFLQYAEVEIFPKRWPQGELLRLVRAAWIQCICSVCDWTHGKWNWGALADAVGHWSTSSLMAYERAVGSGVRELLARCARQQALSSTSAAPFTQWRLTAAEEWIRRSLPVLLSSEHSLGVPQAFREASAPPRRDAEVYWSDLVVRERNLEVSWTDLEVQRPDPVEYPDLEVPGPAVELRRRQLVREAAARSDAYRAHGVRGDRAESWFRSVSEAWFGAAPPTQLSRSPDSGPVVSQVAPSDGGGEPPSPPLHH